MQNATTFGVAVTKQFSSIFNFFAHVKDIKHRFLISYHIHILHVSPQLRWFDTCLINLYEQNVKYTFAFTDLFITRKFISELLVTYTPGHHRNIDVLSLLTPQLALYQLSIFYTLKCYVGMLPGRMNMNVCFIAFLGIGVTQIFKICPQEK